MHENMSTSEISELMKKYPCREQVFEELDGLIANSIEALPNAIYAFGHSGTGKSAILRDFLKLMPIKYKILNCVECYTSKLLYEQIANSFYSYNVTKANNYAPYEKCDSMHSFINQLRRLPSNDSYIICLENAERLRDMEVNILPTFLRLQEVTGLNICAILVSQLPFEKYFLKNGLVEIQTLFFPHYNKSEIQTILANEFPALKNYMKTSLPDEESLSILDALEVDFYDNYLNVFLNVFYRACRDLPELKLISRERFQIYVEPVLNGSIDSNDVGKLWRNISKPLSIALASVYTRVELPMQKPDVCSSIELNAPTIASLAQTLELPYYAKYLLIAAYLASHNAAKKDKRLFVKDHGKQRKRLQNVKAQAKVSEKMQTNLGPQSFTIDRLLAIFYAILDEKVGLNCNLLSQISSLVHLKFLSFVSGESNIMDGSARLQCTVGLEFVLRIGKVVGFNVMQYLCDYM